MCLKVSYFPTAFRNVMGFEADNLMKNIFDGQ